jgi:hypothetical protein
LDTGVLEHAVKPPMSRARGSKRIAPDERLVKLRQKDSSMDRKVSDMIGSL